MLNTNPLPEKQTNKQAKKATKPQTRKTHANQTHFHSTQTEFPAIQREAIQGSLGESSNAEKSILWILSIGMIWVIWVGLFPSFQHHFCFDNHVWLGYNCFEDQHSAFLSGRKESLSHLVAQLHLTYCQYTVKIINTTLSSS